jgi:O-antigen/teichoic acid export membrane protein/capsular polysaccharide biosynthesis protein
VTTSLRGEPGEAPVTSLRTMMRSGALNLAARLTSGAAAFALAILTARVLDTHGRGAYVVLTTMAGVGVVVLSAPAPVMIADLVRERRDEAQLRGGMLALGAGSALVLALAALIVNLAGGELPGHAWVQVLAALATGIVVYVSCEISLAQATGRVTAVGLGEIALATLPLVSSGAVVLFGHASLGSLITAWLAGVCATAALQAWFALRRAAITAPEPGVVGRWLWRARGIAVSNGMLQLCARVDVLVVSAVISVSAAGVYSIPVALAANLLLFPRALLTVTYRSIMTAPREEIARRSASTTTGCAALVLAGGVLGVPLTAVLSGHVFGDAYADIWRPLAVLVPGIAAWAVVEVLRHVLLTRLERQREVLMIALAMAGTNGVLAVAGSSAFGYVGAAASTTITYVAAAIAMARVCSRQLGVPLRRMFVPSVRSPGAEVPGARGAHLDDLMRPIPTGRLALSRADLDAVLRLALIPIVAAVIGAIAGLLYSAGQSTLYESRSQVVVSPASGFLDPAHADSFAAISTTVQELALTQDVLADAVRRLGPQGRTTGWLRGRVRLSIRGDTPLLTIAGVDDTRALARAISTAETDALVQAINAASTATGAVAPPAVAPPSGIILRVFSKGEQARKLQPETSRNTLLGASAGLIVGCFGAAQLLSRQTRRLE